MEHRRHVHSSNNHIDSSNETAESGPTVIVKMLPVTTRVHLPSLKATSAHRKTVARYRLPASFLGHPERVLMTQPSVLKICHMRAVGFRHNNIEGSMLHGHFGILIGMAVFILYGFVNPARS